MSNGSSTEPSRSPAFSVLAESEVGSEISFESLDQEPAPQSSLRATAVMPSAAELDGLDFHPTYSAKDRMVLFQAEKTLFRVHAHFFIRDSPFFRDLLSLETAEQSDFDAAQEMLVRLDGDVKSVDFERLLAIMYPPEFGQYSLTTLDEWTSVLHLSSKWGFESIRSLALRELFPLASPVDKIVLGRKYGLLDWLAPAFVAVCARARPLTLAEARQMHIDDVTRIHEARELARGGSAAAEVEAAQDAVAAVFGDVVETATGTDTNTDAFIASVGPSLPPAPTATAAPISPAPPVSVTLPVAPEVPTESTPTESLTNVASASDPEGAEGVDDGLMDALAAWSRLCTQYESQGYDSRYENYYYCIHDPAPSSWGYGYLGSGRSQYDNYAADYASIVAYLGGSQLQPAQSRRWLVSAMLEGDLETKRPGPCAQIWKDVRDQARDDGTDPGEQHQAADLDRVINEQCVALVAYECALENPSKSYDRRSTLSMLLSRLAEADLVSEATLQACLPHLLPTPSDSALLNPNVMASLRSFLTSHGKFLDREHGRDVMDNVFEKLRRYAFDWKYKNIQQMVIELDALRRKGWVN